MKKLFAILSAVALLALGTAAFAADTATVNVSATVVGSCAFNAATPTVSLAFGSITTPVAADVPAAPATVNVLCSPGTSWTLTDDGGLLGTYTMASGIYTLPYTFSYLPATGTGSGADQPVSITGSLAMGDLNAANVGVYADTVTITLAP